MIASYRNEWTRKIAEGGSVKAGSLDLALARKRLDILDAAQSLADISPLASVGLHKLSKDRAGQWAININGRWRICFRFEGGNAHDVEITDYHKG